MGKVLRKLVSRTFLVFVLALAQILLICGLVITLRQYFSAVYTVLTILSTLVVLVILDKDEIQSGYKIIWLLLIMLLPPTGTLFYIFWGRKGSHLKQAERYQECLAAGAEALGADSSAFDKLSAHDPKLLRNAQYLMQHASAPLYADTASDYFAWGEDFFPEFLLQLRSARHFIFMEYFILEEGYMWDTTLEILKEKAAAGLDVRVIYDAFGCLFTLPEDYDKTLQKYGIRCLPFMPLELRSIAEYRLLNHRDHRKIAVVDGNVGFTGGLNFADEYINRRKRFGVWKDTGLELRGSGVHKLTVSFLEMWDYIAGSTSNYERFAPTLRYSADGFVQPYTSAPLEDEAVAKNAYLNILSQAQHYVYIATPYLVPDEELVTALQMASKSGVDVRIITPGIPDKWYVYWVTQSYYPTLMDAGVRIYEYTPGFIHAKMYVSDDDLAVVGSANMDYRSLYLHFESCCAFYGGQIVRDVKRDIAVCMAQSHEVTQEDLTHVSIFKRLVQVFLRVVGPVL